MIQVHLNVFAFAQLHKKTVLPFHIVELSVKAHNVGFLFLYCLSDCMNPTSRINAVRSDNGFEYFLHRCETNNPIDW